MKVIKKYKKIITDIIMNLFASGIMVIVLQLMVYPLLSNFYNADMFGEILVSMAIVNVVGVLFGSSLNNMRLKYYNKYLKNNLTGDYSVLLLISVFLNALITYTVTEYLTEWDNFVVLTLTSVSVLMMLRSYMQVEFRLKLQYNKILQNNVVYSVGLIFGIVFVYLGANWSFIFLFAEILTFLFLFFTTKIIREPLITTKYFKQTTLNYVYLSLSNGLKNSLMYLDRFILYPIMGPHYVAVFFAASMIGKMSNFVISPISGVVLSYLAQSKEKISIKMYFKIHIVIIIFSSLSAIFAITISYIILPIIYADLFKDTLGILMVANIAAVIRSSTSIPQAIVLRYSKMYQQINIQIMDTVLYMSLGLFGLHFWGLIGFTYGLLITGIIKYIVIALIGYKSLQK